MAKYALDIKPSARKELENLSDRLIARLMPKIEGLAADPRPSGCRKLRDYKDLWRIRAGAYRVVYIIDDDRKIVSVPASPTASTSINSETRLVLSALTNGAGRRSRQLHCSVRTWLDYLLSLRLRRAGSQAIHRWRRIGGNGGGEIRTRPPALIEASAGLVRNPRHMRFPSIAAAATCHSSSQAP